MTEGVLKWEAGEANNSATNDGEVPLHPPIMVSHFFGESHSLSKEIGNDMTFQVRSKCLSLSMMMKHLLQHLHKMELLQHLPSIWNEEFTLKFSSSFEYCLHVVLN
jgi:hypothetical protein